MYVRQKISRESSLGVRRSIARVARAKQAQYKIGGPTRGNPLEGLTEIQLDVLQSPARFKALLWGRRSGKTDLEVKDMADGLLAVPVRAPRMKASENKKPTRIRRGF